MWLTVTDAAAYDVRRDLSCSFEKWGWWLSAFMLFVLLWLWLLTFVCLFIFVLFWQDGLKMRLCWRGMKELES